MSLHREMLTSKKGMFQLQSGIIMVLMMALLAVSPLLANETEISSLKKIIADYEFRDGTLVMVQASTDINKNYGRGVLMLQKLELSLSGKSIGQEKLRALIPKILGIKLETIKISRNVVGDYPGTTQLVYTLSFDYFSDAFGSAVPASWEQRKKMSIRFDENGIKEIVGEEKESGGAQVGDKRK